MDARARCLPRSAAQARAGSGVYMRVVSKKRVAEFVQILPAQGAGPVQFDVIGDDHDIARPVAQVHAARRVRHNRPLRAPSSFRSRTGCVSCSKS